MAEHTIDSARGIPERGNRRRRLSCLGLIASVAIATAASAADHPGKAPYDQYCAACHGTAGDGNGPVAGAMKTKPTDLRKLGKEFGTPLSNDKLFEVIDGRAMVSAHGTQNMPVWGEKLAEGTSPTTNNAFFKRGTIRVIVDYLETMQTQ